MFRKLFYGILKLSVYSAMLVFMAGVWDFTRQGQESADGITVAEYATSVSERYGPQVSQIATLATQSANTGFAKGMDLAKSSGVLEKIGVELPFLDVPPQAELEEQEVTSPDDVIVLASVNAIAAPETSLFPRARASQ